MYIILAGGGLIGKGVARKLVEHKHDVVLVDVDPDVCRDVYARYGAVTVTGNATDINVLESAGIEKCDVAVATMRRDSDNLAFSLLARHFSVRQIAVRMMDPRYEEVYKSVGVSNITRTTELLIDQMMVNIESPELRKVINLGTVDICLFNLPSDTPCAGKTVRDIASMSGFPKHLIITCVYKEKDGSYQIPRGDTVLEPDDRLFLSGTDKDIQKAVRILS